MEKTIAGTHFELIRRSQEHDREAQHQLYQLYAAPMFNVSYRIINQREEAEDVLQECFIKMFNQLSTFRQEATFGSWFKRIVINASLNHLKKRNRDQDRMQKISPEQVNDIEDEKAPENLMSYSVPQIQAAMEALPEGYRLVFNLYLFEDWSHKAIAEELGISESTSKSQLNRAKNKMKEILIYQRYEKNE